MKNYFNDVSENAFRAIIKDDFITYGRTSKLSTLAFKTTKFDINHDPR